MRPARVGLNVGIVLGVLAAVCFARLVAEPRTLLVDAQRPSVDRALREDFRPPGNDATFLFIPHHAHVVAALARTGRLPQWDDSGFAGRPMVGNPQGGLFYPAVWLAWLWWSPAALGWVTVGHLIGAGIGMYLLMRTLGAGRWGATVAAGCLQASPYFLGHTFEGHYPHVWAACWYPWAFWAYVRARAGSRPAWLALPAVLSLCLLTGHPQEAFYLALALSAWVLADAIALGREGDRRGLVLRLAAWGGVVVLAVGLAGVELVPDIAAQKWALRGNRLSLGRISHYQVHGLNLFQLLAPSALGGPADYVGPDNYWETVLSIGLVPLILAALAVARHPDRRLVRGWTLLVVATVVFAAGRKLGLFPLLFGLVPGMNRFRVAARSLFLASLGASALAGLGIEALWQGAAGAEAWPWLRRNLSYAAPVLLAALLLLLSIGVLSRGESSAVQRPPAQRLLTQRETRRALRALPAPEYRGAEAAARVLGSGVFWLALIGTAGLAAAARLRPERRGLWATALGTLALVELGLHGHALIRVSPPERFLGPDPISAALAAARPPFAGPFRIRARDPLYHDLRAASNGFEKININDSFQLQHAADLYQVLYPLLYLPPPIDRGDPMAEAVAEHRRAVRQAALDRLSIAFLVSDHVESEPHWPLVVAGSFNGSPFAVHRNPTAMPRAYVVPRALPSARDFGGILAQLRDVDPRAAVLMLADVLPATGPRQPFRPAQWCSHDPDRVVVRVATGAPGYLVVADTWLPGWTATDNGRRVPVLLGNHSQRVVPLRRAGNHVVVLRYEAPGFVKGLALSLATAGLLALAVISVILTTRRKLREASTVSPYPRPWLLERDRSRFQGARSVGDRPGVPYPGT
jgi:hypothetical protein